MVEYDVSEQSMSMQLRRGEPARRLSWPGNTVAKRNKYTNVLTIENVEVEFDPVFDKYFEVIKVR